MPRTLKEAGTEQKMPARLWGGYDEQCAMPGRDKIKKDLK
jgi:hypothetical protein